MYDYITLWLRVLKIMSNFTCAKFSWLYLNFDFRFELSKNNNVDLRLSFNDVEGIWNWNNNFNCFYSKQKHCETYVDTLIENFLPEVPLTTTQDIWYSSTIIPQCKFFLVQNHGFTSFKLFDWPTKNPDLKPLKNL